MEMLVFTVLLFAAGGFASPVVLSGNVHSPATELFPPRLDSEQQRNDASVKHHVKLNDNVNQASIQRRTGFHHPVPAVHQPNFDHTVEKKLPVSAVHQPVFDRSAVEKNLVNHHLDGHQQVHSKTRSQDSAEVSEGSPRIIQQDMEVNPDGSFHNVWNSENGISVQEHGVVKQVGETAVSVQNGEISYVDNEGHQYHLRYVADENGFRVEGDHLPTPPPIPAGIARGLEFIAAHPPPPESSSSDSDHNQFRLEEAPVVIDN